MTALTKRVVRKTRGRVPHGVRAEIVVTLYPGGIIGLRELGRRKEYDFEVGALYSRAVLAEARNGKKVRR